MMGSPGGAGGSFTTRRGKPAAHPDHAVTPEQRTAMLHRVKSARDESISRLSARRQEREGLQMASNQALVEETAGTRGGGRGGFNGSKNSLLESAAQLSMFYLDRPQTAGVNTSSRGLISASGSGTMPSPRAFGGVCLTFTP